MEIYIKEAVKVDTSSTQKRVQPYHYFHIIHHSIPLKKLELRKMLFGLVEVLRMTPLSKIIMKKGNADEGWTGLIIIEQSHIAFHSFDELGETWVDILSCKKFSQKKVKLYLDTCFKH